MLEIPYTAFRYLDDVYHHRSRSITFSHSLSKTDCLISTFENIHSERETKRSSDYIVCIRDVPFPWTSLHFLQQKQTAAGKPSLSAQDDQTHASPGSKATSSSSCSPQLGVPAQLHAGQSRGGAQESDQPKPSPFWPGFSS